MAIYPNGETTMSSGAVEVQSGCINLKAKVYDNNKLMRPLIAAHDITSQGNTIVLDNRSLTVKDQEGKIIAHSCKEPDTRLWSMPALKATTTITPERSHTVNNTHARMNMIVHHAVHASITNYANATMGSPPDRTMLQALDRDYFRYPGLTPQMYRRNPPHAIESSEGHMKQSRQNVRSTRQNPDNSTLYNHVTNDIALLRAYTRVWDTSSSDLPGPFPVASLKGYRYILITTYRNYIHAEPMKSRSQQDYKRAYADTFKFFRDMGHSPKYHRMDNETSSLIENFLENELDIPVQYVPPGSHRTLPAERSIQSYKNHFISSVSHMHPDCPLQLWANFMPQIETTLTCLLPYSLDPKISAYEGIHGNKYDFNAHPMHPVGTLTLAFTPTTSREAWEPHGMKGFMTGPALKHYRSFRVHIIETGQERKTDTVDVFPTKVMLPGSSLGEILLKKLDENPNDESKKTDKIEEIRRMIKSNQTVLEQRVKPTSGPVIPVPKQRVQSTAPHHLTVSTKATKRHKIADSTYELYPKLMIVASKRMKIMEHVGRTFKDNEDGQTYQVQRVVKSKADKKNPPTAFYELANINEHSNSRRLNELDYEYQPCEEFFILKRGGDYQYRGNEYEWLPTLNSVYHAKVDQQLLNLDDDGKPLTNRSALKSVHRADWLNEHAKEIKNLMKTGTIVPRRQTDQPRDRWKDTKHYSPQVKEKLAEDSTVLRRVRGTFGGNNLHYPFPTTSPVADRTLINIHQQSVLADRKRTGEDWRYMCADFKDYYLGSKLPRSEWLRISTKYMNEELLIELQDYVVAGTVLFEVIGSMYGHPAAGLIAYTDLVTHLAAHGYYQSRLIPCLFMNHDKSITFTLVVDDIGIKYKHGAGQIKHLQKILAKPVSKWAVKFDLTGSQYNGQRLQWNYGKSDSTLVKDIPAYMKQAIQELHPDETIRKYNTPSRYVAPTYGIQTAPMQSSAAPATASETKYIQKVHGKLLYYAMQADPSLEPAVIDISKQLAKPTQDTLSDTKRLLGYAVHNPNRGILYKASDMEYRIQTDASHHRDPESRSMAGGIHYLSNKDDPPTTVNGATKTVCKAIQTSVCASAAESEYAAQFINGVAGCHAINILHELGYPQSNTKIYSDNLVAKGIANDEITIRKSKAFHTRYHWIRDRVRQGQYKVVYLEGAKLLADFFTKPQPPIKQKYFASQLTIPTY